MIQKVLIVCTANICRSPMAEGICRRVLTDAGRAIEVSSAGVRALIGHPIASDADDVLRHRGIDLSAHRARQISDDLLRTADLVWVMDNEQRTALRAIFPAYAGKVFLLGHWMGVEIDDPYQRGIHAFEDAAQLIEHALTAWVNKLP